MSGQEELISSAPKTSSLSFTKKIGLTFIFFTLLMFFTLTKLPQAKITALIQGFVQQSLDPYGIYVSDQGRELSIWKGFVYRLNQPTLELPDQSRVELEELVVSPKWSSLIRGRIGAQVEIQQILERTPSKTDFSRIVIEGTGRGDLIDATVRIENLDLGKIGILSFAGGLKGSGLLKGEIHIEGHLADLPSLTGNVDLSLSRFHLDEQSLFGFQLPVMDVKEGVISAQIESGRLKVKQIQIGKPGDDLQLNMNGEIVLNRNLNSSTLNLGAKLGFSDKVKQSLSLLDTFMGSAKQPDGQYAYKLTGSFMAPFPVPDTQK